MKKFLLYTFAALTLMLAITLAGARYLISYALDPREFTDNRYNTTLDTLYAQYPHLEGWVDSLQQNSALRDTTIIKMDGSHHHAYYVQAPRPTQKTAVIVHGYTDNAMRMFMIGYMYNHSLGYNILLPDLHYHGQSSGEAIQMGWFDRCDVMEWMHFANERFGGSTKMVVHGISMGAATTMMLSGESQEPYVRCFVEDCGYTSVWAQYKKELREQFSLPSFPILDAASYLCDVMYGWNFREASAIKQLKKCTLPMLFIHGAEDDFVPTSMVYELYDAKREEKELWVAPASRHALSYHDHPEEYTRRVEAFVSKYI